MGDKKKNCNNLIQALVTIILTLGGLIVMFFLFTKPIPDDNKSILYSIIGSCTTVYLACMAYWFGGSHLTSTKDDMLYKSQPLEKIKENETSTEVNKKDL